MKKALIDENSVVAQVENETFGVASPCFWVDCADDVVAYAYKYENGTIVPIPTIPKTADENKEMAKQKLKDSDWTVLSDVNLQNKTAWETYRASLRAIVLNPQSGDLVWPSQPQEIWG